MMGFHFYEHYVQTTAAPTTTLMAIERFIFRRFFGRMWGRMN
jgi:hypothetical protein